MNQQISKIINASNGLNIDFMSATGEALTPSDTNTFTPGSLFIGTSGNISVIFANDDTYTAVLLKNIPDGSFLPILVKAVKDTDTTATDIVILR